MKYRWFVLVVDDVVLKLDGRDARRLLGPALSAVCAHVAQ